MWKEYDGIMRTSTIIQGQISLATRDWFEGESIGHETLPSSGLRNDENRTEGSTLTRSLAEVSLTIRRTKATGGTIRYNLKHSDLIRSGQIVICQKDDSNINTESRSYALIEAYLIWVELESTYYLRRSESDSRPMRDTLSAGKKEMG